MSVTYSIRGREVRLVVTPDADHPLRIQDLRELRDLRASEPRASAPRAPAHAPAPAPAPRASAAAPRRVMGPSSSIYLRLSAPLDAGGKPIRSLDPCIPENWGRGDWWTGWADGERSWSVVFGLKGPQPTEGAVPTTAASPHAASPHVGFSYRAGNDAYSLLLPLARVKPVVEKIIADLLASQSG